MKKVNLKNMTLTNFRGHKDLTVQFSELTTISGDNRLGKSTVFDAFVWLLFGKDQFDRPNHEITPIVNGKRLEKVDSEVSATVIVDGREMSLKRVLHQKWVRKRGTAEEVFDGTETLFFWDEVPLKAGEYKARVDLLIEETIFKLITNPSTFIGLHWTKQREFLFNIAGTITDQQIAESNPNFKLLLEAINGKSFVEFKKELSARKRKLNDELDTIAPKIDQTTRLMPEAKDWTALEKELGEVEASITSVDVQISDRSKAIRGQYEEIQGKQKDINDLKTKQRDLVNMKETEAHQEAFKSNQNRSEISNLVETAFRKFKTSENDREDARRGLETLNTKAKNLNADIEALREKWTAENEREYKVQVDCLVCPVFGSVCGDLDAQVKHSEDKKKAEKAFFDTKEKNLEVINQEGSKKADELGFITGRIKDGEKYLKEASEKVTALEKEYQDLFKQLETMAVAKPVQIIASELPYWQELDKQIKEIEATITEVAPVDNTELNNRKAELITKRDQLKKQLSSRETIISFNQEIEKLKVSASEIAQQISDAEKTEYLIQKFDTIKIEEAAKRINGLFTIVNFQLFDITIEALARLENDKAKGVFIDLNNYYTPCCIATNKLGIPISATNTAERINAGLDIIATLSAFYNVSAPIFCDQAESNNNYVNVGAQMIFLRVTKEPVLTISNN